MKRLLILGAALSVLALPLHAAEKLTVGYQTVVEPSKVPQAAGAYDAATGAKVDWRKFDSGADVIAAIASGALDIGYVGSSPLAAAASRREGPRRQEGRRALRLHHPLQPARRPCA
jgi:taurine transport system substrate-binding protein